MPPCMPKYVTHSRDRITPGRSTLVVVFWVFGAWLFFSVLNFNGRWQFEIA